MRFLLGLVLACTYSMSSWAQTDMGYRYNADINACVNATGELGYNPGYYGQCGSFDGNQTVFSKTYYGPADFSGMQVRGTKSAGVFNLTQVKMAGVVFADQDLREARLYNVTATRANFEGADFSMASSSNVDFAFANLSRAQFVNSSFYSVSFANADLSNANFDSARFSSDPVFYRADIRGADLSNITTSSNVSDFCYLFMQAKYNESTKLPDSWDMYSSKKPEECMVKTN